MSPLHIFVYDKITLLLLCIFHVLLLSTFTVLKTSSCKFVSVKIWFLFWQRQEISLFPKASRPAQRSIHPLFRWVSGKYSWEWSGRSVNLTIRLQSLVCLCFVMLNEQQRSNITYRWTTHRFVNVVSSINSFTIFFILERSCLIGELRKQ
jgi:hypothetical protein